MKKKQGVIRCLITVFALIAAVWVVLAFASAEEQGTSLEMLDIPFPCELVETVSAEDVNAWWAEQGYDQPPYLPGTTVNVLRLSKDTVFARVFDGEVSGKFGGWIMDFDALDGMTPVEIRNLFALPALPKYRVDVILPAGSLVRRGICNALSEWGEGGGIQYDMMGERIGDFINERPLEEEAVQNDEAV